MLKVLLTIGGMQVAAMAALLLRTKGLALLLGPADVGMMAVIDKLVAMVSQTTSMSLPFAAIRFLPGLKQRPAEFRRLRRSMAVTLGAVSVATALASTGLAVVRPSIWGVGLADYQVWVALGLMTVPILSLASFLPSALAGGLQYRQAMSFTVAHAVALSVSGLLGAWFGGVRGVYVAYAILAGSLVVIIFRRMIASSPNEPDGPTSLPAPVWKFGVAMLGLSWIVPFAALYIHYDVLRHFGANVSGYMQAAMGIAVAIRSVLGSGHQFFLTPYVNRTGTPAERMAWAVRYQGTLALLVGLVIPPLLLVADLLVRVLYSDAFLAAAPHVWMFVMVETLTLFAGTYQSLILAFDHLWYHVVQNLLAQLIVIVLAFVLVPNYGLVGAALAPIGGQIVIWAGTLLFLRHRFVLRVPAHTTHLTAAAVAAALVGGLVGAHFPWSVAGVAARFAAWAIGVALLAASTNEAERAKLAILIRNGPRDWVLQVKALMPAGSSE